MMRMVHSSQICGAAIASSLHLQNALHSGQIRAYNLPKHDLKHNIIIYGKYSDYV